MCLFVSYEETLKEDLIVYKYQIKTFPDEKYRSPCCNHVPEYGKLLKAEADPNLEHKKNRCYTTLEDEYFHCYTSVPYFKKWSFSYSCRVIKCIIPKGTKVFLNSDRTEIASRELIFTEEVEFEYSIAYGYIIKGGEHVLGSI